MSFNGLCVIHGKLAKGIWEYTEMCVFRIRKWVVPWVFYNMITILKMHGMTIEECASC